MKRWNNNRGLEQLNLSAIKADIIIDKGKENLVEGYVETLRGNATLSASVDLSIYQIIYIIIQNQLLNRRTSAMHILNSCSTSKMRNGTWCVYWV